MYDCLTIVIRSILSKMPSVRNLPMVPSPPIIVKDLSRQCTRLRCSAHMCMLVPCELHEGGNVVRFYGCPVRFCQYMRADKWGAVNSKRQVA